jgi:hypothetical protein
MPRFRFHGAPVDLGALPARDDAEEFDWSGRSRIVRLNRRNAAHYATAAQPTTDHSPATAETPALRAINERNRRHYGGDDAA